MSKSNFISLTRIKDNKNEDQVTVCKTLISIIDKIINSPQSETTRQLDLLSDDVVNNLMPFNGGLDSLFEIGFVENDETLVLPKNASLDVIRSFKNELENILNPVKEPVVVPKKNDEKCATTIEKRQKHKVKSPIDLGVATPNHRVFYSKLAGSFDHVLVYEDKNIQSKALNVIPVDRVKRDGTEKYNLYRSEVGSNHDKYKLGELEFVVEELLKWFKNEFFQWVDKANCDLCQTNEFMVFHENSYANESEMNWGANSVESYKCNKCFNITRFPRYNHPGKLLDTHKGRCGEWANCFTLCLRAMDIEARYVLDWTDHVWSEFYSPTQKRWIHADPCEACFDKPLLYEHGWGKKLTYVIAMSKDEIVDVTWRYSGKHQEVLARRNECDELWLIKLLEKMNNQRQASMNLSKERIDELKLRFVTELVEFVSPKQIKEGEDIGRQSGSLQWRLTRGEISNTVKETNYAFKPDEHEIEKLKLSVQYNTSKDEYHRGSEITKNWINMTNKCINIQRKVENDWKMCYLARTEGSQTAFIEWLFDFSNLKDKIKVKELTIKCTSSCFESGEISWSLTCDDKTSIPIKTIGENEQFKLNDIDPSYHLFKLRVDLSNGNGVNAFQHTQLFRQKLDAADNLFDVCFLFEKK